MIFNVIVVKKTKQKQQPCDASLSGETASPLDRDACRRLAMLLSTYTAEESRGVKSKLSEKKVNVIGLLLFHHPNITLPPERVKDK